ncbi:MAG: glycosyltransferase family 9 protein [Verrucomicrobiales bacterium]
MEMLILKCFLSPGDIVMLTAAVRDLHRCYPGLYATDVRTSCPALWENNPHLTALDENDPEVRVIKCHYPLIHISNQTPVHFLYGFIEHLNDRLGLGIRPTELKGDIHLSEDEKTLPSPVVEHLGEEQPYWIVAAGGKYDYTIKWWSRRRYQEVVDALRGRVFFVQVGEMGHFHPPLRHVLDLRGKTSMRELIRLVYHADGVLCPVTLLMHLASAVPVRPPARTSRGCVVIAGGREPPHWEAYPTHRFLHTVGTLPCCAHGGCWRSRTVALGDGQPHDEPHRLCLDVVRGLPRCMDKIASSLVIENIRLSLPHESSIARRPHE